MYQTYHTHAARFWNNPYMQLLSVAVIWMHDLLAKPLSFLSTNYKFSVWFFLFFVLLLSISSVHFRVKYRESRAAFDVFNLFCVVYRSRSMCILISSERSQKEDGDDEYKYCMENKC